MQLYKLQTHASATVLFHQYRKLSNSRLHHASLWAQQECLMNQNITNRSMCQLMITTRNAPMENEEKISVMIALAEEQKALFIHTHVQRERKRGRETERENRDKAVGGGGECAAGLWLWLDGRASARLWLDCWVSAWYLQRMSHLHNRAAGESPHTCKAHSASSKYWTSLNQWRHSATMWKWKDGNRGD